jgi:hypothetical protein
MSVGSAAALSDVIAVLKFLGTVGNLSSYETLDVCHLYFFTKIMRNMWALENICITYLSSLYVSVLFVWDGLK